MLSAHRSLIHSNSNLCFWIITKRKHTKTVKDFIKVIVKIHNKNCDVSGSIKPKGKIMLYRAECVELTALEAWLMGHMRTAVLYHYCRSTDVVKYYKNAVFLLAYNRKAKIITYPPPSEALQSQSCLQTALWEPQVLKTVLLYYLIDLNNGLAIDWYQCGENSLVLCAEAVHSCAENIWRE